MALWLGLKADFCPCTQRSPHASLEWTVDWWARLHPRCFPRTNLVNFFLVSLHTLEGSIGPQGLFINHRPKRVLHHHEHRLCILVSGHWHSLVPRWVREPVFFWEEAIRSSKFWKLTKRDENSRKPQDYCKVGDLLKAQLETIPKSISCAQGNPLKRNFKKSFPHFGCCCPRGCMSTI